MLFGNHGNDQPGGRTGLPATLHTRRCLSNRVMGLLSALGIFQAPEAVLERQLQANPYHRFHLASSEGEDENKGSHHALITY